MGVTAAIVASVVATTVATAVSTAVGIAGGVASYNQQKSNYAQQKANAEAQAQQAEYNRRLEMREAENQEKEAAEQARRQRAEAEEYRSRQIALLGKSGAALTSGSPLAILGETAARQEMTIQDTHRSGALQYNKRMTQAQQFGYQAELARNSVMKPNAGLSLLTSFGNTAANALTGTASALNTYGTAKHNGLIKWS